MNCLEFRRAALVDPRRLDCEVARHAESCAPCREFLAHGLETEAHLARMLRIPVPQGLRARLLERKAPRRPVRWLALAASLLLAAAVGFFAGTQRNDPMALAGIDFVMYEEAQSIADAKPTDWNVLVRVAAEMGVSLPEQLGEMRYVCIYPFVAGAAHHLLVKTPQGKITLLLIPDRPAAARLAGAAHGLEAVVLPAAKGSVIIIGDSARSVVRAESLLKSS